MHEFNALRGVLGEPTEVVYASLARESVSVNLRFGEIPCHLSWVDLLPGIARYKQEFAFYAPEQRLTLELPSPYLRNEPSRLIVEGGEVGTTHSWAREETLSYDEAFRRELDEFADCIATGTHAAHVRARRSCRPAAVRGGGAQAPRAGCRARLAAGGLPLSLRRVMNVQGWT